MSLPLVRKADAVVNKSADYIITDADNIRTLLITTGASSITITLPDVVLNNGRKITIKKQDAGAGSVNVASVDLIDGASNVNIGIQYHAITVQSNGTSWFALNEVGASGGGGLTLNADDHTINGDTLASGTHYIIDMGNASSNISTTLPTGATSSMLRVSIVNNATNGYIMNIAADTGQKIRYDGVDYDDVDFTLAESWVQFMWDNNDSIWVVDDPSVTYNGNFLGDLNVTGDFSVDTDTLFVDKSTGRVGIGGTPSYELDVVGNGRFYKSASNQVLRLQSDVDNYASMGIFPDKTSTNGFFIGTRTTTAASDLSITYGTGPASDNGMRITQTGDVGINASPIRRKLHIHSAGTATVLRLSASGATTQETQNFVEFYHENNAERQGYIGYGTSSNSDLSIVNQLNGGVGITSNSKTGLYIENGGNVLIGDDSFGNTTRHSIRGQVRTFGLDSSVVVGASGTTNVLDFSGKPAGLYLVSASRTGGSVSTHAVYIVGFSGTVVFVHGNLSLSGAMTGGGSGTWFTLTNTGSAYSMLCNALYLVGGN